MSHIHSITTADYLPWDTMLNLIRRLFRDGDYKMSLLIGCGSFSVSVSLTCEILLGLNCSMMILLPSMRLRRGNVELFGSIRAFVSILKTVMLP